MSRILVAAGFLCFHASSESSKTFDLEQELQKMKGKMKGNSGGSDDSKSDDSKSKSGGEYQKHVSQNAGGSSGGDYQKYYQKYMNQYGGGQGGSSSSYQKSMNEYADKYAGKYVNQYASKYTKGQGGGYQQYASKYTKGQGGGYQQYMDKYAGGQGASYEQADDASSSLDLMEEAPKESSDGSEMNLDSKSSDSQGNYQQYMNQYAGSQGGSSGGYQQYMKQYADKYAGKYMNQYANKYAGGGHGSQDGSETNLDAKSSNSQGNYQQYMNQYAGGQGGSSGSYQKYMKQYADKYSGQYMNQYANKYTGGKGGHEQADDASSSLDLMEEAPKESSDGSEMNLDSKSSDSQGNYQQYMNQYAGGQGGSSGSYQKYMKQYADKYAGKYMNAYTGGKGGHEKPGDASSSMDLMEEGAKESSDSDARRLKEVATGHLKELRELEQEKHPKKESQGADSNSQGNYQQYMKKYAGQYEKYGDYQKHMKNQNGQGQDIGSAQDCKTKAQLDKWLARAHNNLKAYVPDEYSKYANDDIDKKYQKRLAELEGTTKTGGSVEAINLDEENMPAGGDLEAINLDENTPAAKSIETFMAKHASSAETTEAEKLQSPVVANLQMYADEVNSNPAECAVMGLLVAAFSALVFFAVRHRRNIADPYVMLG